MALQCHLDVATAAAEGDSQTSLVVEEGSVAEGIVAAIAVGAARNQLLRT